MVTSTVQSTGSVSNEEIERIETYNDYITVYGKIVNNYIDNYKAKMDEYGLGDDATYQSLKDGVDQGVQEQKNIYGAMGSQKIIGKSELVTFLKEYRDELQAVVDSLG